jgi:hypothetical protein
MYSPIQRNRHRPQPTPHHRPNQPAIHLIHRQHQRHNLPPRLAPNTVHIHERQRTQQRNVCGAQQRVHVVRGHGRAEQDEHGGEERRRCEEGQEQGEECGLLSVSGTHLACLYGAGYVSGAAVYIQQSPHSTRSPTSPIPIHSHSSSSPQSCSSAPSASRPSAAGTRLHTLSAARQAARGGPGARTRGPRRWPGIGMRRGRARRRGGYVCICVRRRF